MIYYQTLKLIDIYIKGISLQKPSSNSDYINAQLLTMQKCKRLIFKYLKIIEPNCYQIESYINVIA